MVNNYVWSQVIFKHQLKVFVGPALAVPKWVRHAGTETHTKALNKES